MVNVKQHKVFPTIINEFEFDMDKQECDLVIDELNDMEKYKENNLVSANVKKLADMAPELEE